MCIECNGMYSNCPVCQSVDTHMEKCTDCNGEGKIYFNDNGDILTKEEWLKLPEDERSYDDCITCEASGEICVED